MADSSEDKGVYARRMKPTTSILGVVRHCDKYENRSHKCALTNHDFPETDLHRKLWTVYGLSPLNSKSVKLGFMHENVTKRMPRVNGYVAIDEHFREFSVEERGFNVLAAEARKSDQFPCLRGWRDELYPVIGMPGGWTIERAACALFGLVTIGVHMNGYVRSPDAPYGLKLWIGKRAATKSTFPGMLDNTVAGGIGVGEPPLECLVREADEEASLPAALVEQNAKACGTVTYFLVEDQEKEYDCELLQPEMQYVYDLEIPEDVMCKPHDKEVDAFLLKTVPEVKQAILDGEFKPNCALVLIDFFVRHGILTPQNEPEYAEIVARIHRTLPFPLPKEHS